jgi:hypothetical protein
LSIYQSPHDAKLPTGRAMLAEIFSSQDAGVIIAAMVPISLGIFKLLFKDSPSSRTRFHNFSSELHKLGIQLAEVKVKAETAFDMLIKQAINAVVASGIGTKNSPLKINQEAREWLAPLKAELQAWYQTVKGMDDRDQLFSLEKTFGTRLLDEVCIPHKLVYGVCLLIAFAVASDNDAIDLPFLTASSPENMT